jgi:hypothetical protein
MYFGRVMFRYLSKNHIRQQTAHAKDDSPRVFHNDRRKVCEAEYEPGQKERGATVQADDGSECDGVPERRMVP